ncbi:hypothetical protein AAG906_035886 [Vitis piasezkii]
MELVRESARELELEPRGLWRLLSQAWRASPEKRSWPRRLKQDRTAPFVGFSCGLKERKTWPFVLQKMPISRKRHFRDHFAIRFALRIECHCPAKWHTCAKIAFAIAKYPAEWNFGCEIRIFTLYRLAIVLRNRGSCAAKWHSCAKLAFAENFSLRIPKCCGMVWQQNAHFAKVFFRLRNLAELCFCSFHCFLLRFRSDFFFSISLQSFPPGSLKD